MRPRALPCRAQPAAVKRRLGMQAPHSTPTPPRSYTLRSPKRPNHAPRRSTYHWARLLWRGVGMVLGAEASNTGLQLGLALSAARRASTTATASFSHSHRSPSPWLQHVGTPLAPPTFMLHSQSTPAKTLTQLCFSPSSASRVIGGIACPGCRSIPALTCLSARLTRCRMLRSGRLECSYSLKPTFSPTVLESCSAAD